MAFLSRPGTSRSVTLRPGTLRHDTSRYDLIRYVTPVPLHNVMLYQCSKCSADAHFVYGYIPTPIDLKTYYAQMLEIFYILLYIIIYIYIYFFYVIIGRK